MATTGIITTSKLSKSFSVDGRQQHVLKNLDLTIRGGDFTVIMGPSGAGKSTLLYALSGMDTPSLGSVSFEGTEITSLRPDALARFRRKHCGFVFQSINLLQSMSVRDNVVAPGLLVSPRTAVVTRADALLTRVGLSADDARKNAAVLSGGEAQRAAIARALINEPTVLFADEPTGQLNSETSERVLDLLVDVNAGGQTIVMVTHDINSALRGNRILYLRDGTVQGELDLPRYVVDAPDRREYLTNFLAEMGW